MGQSKEMKTVIANVWDESGGAAKAAMRLHQGLQDEGVNNQFFCKFKDSDQDNVQGLESGIRRKLGEFQFYLNYLPAGRTNLRNKNPLFSPSWVPNRSIKSINSANPDVVNLHWITNFLHPEYLPSINAPIVWTLHDMWAFTGGCHYSGNCNKYKSTCKNCPILEHNRKRDLSFLLQWRKHHAWGDFEMTIVTPSNWLANCANDSALLSEYPIEVINNGVDLEFFRPMDSEDARRDLGLPQEKSLVLFGGVGVNPAHRKGVDLLDKALSLVEIPSKEFAIVTFGNVELNFDDSVPVYDLGYVADEEIPTVYNVADATIVPSRQENLSNIIIESLACGTPPVAFDVGGMNEMVDHKKNGYLVDELSGTALARGIDWVLQSDVKKLSGASRTTANEKFSQDYMTKNYISLFESLT